MVDIVVELIEKTEKELRRAKEAFDNILEHYKEMENGQALARNSF